MLEESQTTGLTSDAIQLQLVQAVNRLNQTLNAIFPGAAASISHTATGGADTLPANPAGFLLLNIAGVAYKVPLYLP